MPTPSTALQRRSRSAGAAALVLVLLVVAACGAGAASTSPSPTGSAIKPTAAASPSPVATPVSRTEPGTSPKPTPPGQTDTTWGRIWDGLPAGFPAWAGATPTETGAGPASATLDAGTAKPADVATFYQSALEGAGYSTVSKTGPREDGSWELNSTGAAGCQVRTTAAPLGASTIITVLYGAACPFD